MPRKPTRAPARDPRDAMTRFDRLLAAMAPKPAIAEGPPKKLAPRGRKKPRPATSTGMS